MGKESQGKVLIKCLPDPCGPFRYAVSLLDSEEKTVYEGTTSDEGTAEVPILRRGDYEVVVKAPACMCPRMICRWVTLNPRGTCGLSFTFGIDLFLPDSRNAAFHLTDRNYVGLPISKGELYLCQDPM